MDPWKTLGLSSDAQSKEIKRAYAKKLKFTRPDEKPREFQVLHEAYKTALNIAKYRDRIPLQTNDQIIDASVNTSDDDFSDEEYYEKNGSFDAEGIITPPLVEMDNDIAAATAISQDENRKRELQEALDSIIGKAEALLANRSRIGNLEIWEFVTECPHLLDEEFNWHLGRELFRLLAEQSHKKVRVRGRYCTVPIPQSIVMHFDALFSWRNKAHHFQNEFGPRFCFSLFRSLERDHQSNSATEAVRGGRLIQVSDSQIGNRETARNYRDENSLSWGWATWGVIVVLIFLLGKVAPILDVLLEESSLSYIVSNDKDVTTEDAPKAQDDLNLRWEVLKSTTDKEYLALSKKLWSNYEQCTFLSSANAGDNYNSQFSSCMEKNPSFSQIRCLDIIEENIVEQGKNLCETLYPTTYTQKNDRVKTQYLGAIGGRLAASEGEYGIAIKIFEDCIGVGSLECYYRLGKLRLSDNDSVQDVEKGLALLAFAAENGHVDAFKELSLHNGE